MPVIILDRFWPHGECEVCRVIGSGHNVDPMNLFGNSSPVRTQAIFSEFLFRGATAAPKKKSGNRLVRMHALLRRTLQMFPNQAQILGRWEPVYQTSKKISPTGPKFRPLSG